MFAQNILQIDLYSLLERREIKTMEGDGDGDGGGSFVWIKQQLCECQEKAKFVLIS